MFLDSHGEQPQSPPSKMIMLPVPVVALGHAPLLYALLTDFSFFFFFQYLFQNFYLYIYLYIPGLCCSQGALFFHTYLYLFICLAVLGVSCVMWDLIP